MTTEIDMSPFREPKDQSRKLFGEKVSQIDKNEVPSLSGKIIERIKEKYPNAQISLTEALEDKEHFGDLDFVLLSDFDSTQDNQILKDVFGDDLIQYTRSKNDTVDHCQIRIEPDRFIQVDFIRAKNEQDFETKKIYYSKNPLPATIGSLAHYFGYKFGVAGFTRTYRDSKGQIHDLLITPDLMLAMDVLGFDHLRWQDVKTQEDVVKFIKDSAFYSPEIYMKRSKKRRKEIQNNPQQAKLYQRLGSSTDLLHPGPNPEAMRSAFEENFFSQYGNFATTADAEIASIEANLTRPS